MSQHEPTRRIRRQREARRAERQHERHVANATLKDAVRALGAGDADLWDQDEGEGQNRSPEAARPQGQAGRSRVAGVGGHPEAGRAGQ